MHASKRTATMSTRVEPEIEDFVARYCLCEGITHSDLLRNLLLELYERTQERWEKLRPVFQNAPDLQEKHED